MPAERAVMNMRRLTISVILTLMASLAVTTRAHASNEEAKERAARKACLSGNYQKGVEILSDLFIRTGNPVFIYNQGRCLEQSGRSEEAINRFREYLRKAKDASAEDRADAEKHITDCQALLDEKAAHAVGTHAEPAPTPAQKNAAEQPATPGPKAASEPARGTLAEPPPPAPAVPDTSGQLVANPPQPPASPGRTLRIAGIACGVAGVGSIATGIYFYTRARSFSDKVSSQDVTNSSDESSGKNAETMQWVFYSIGGAALATGTVLYLLGWPNVDSNTRTSGVAPLLGPGLAGVSAHGSF